MPTMRPPKTPIRTVGTILMGTCVSGGPGGRRRLRNGRATMPVEAARSAQASQTLMWCWRTSPAPNFRSRTTPRKAEGSDPTINHLARATFTVPRRRCTPPPMGFMIKAATTSLETAASGWIPKMSTSIGVMRAPPPTPVIPTTEPTMKPPRASGKSMLTPHFRRDDRTPAEGGLCAGASVAVS